jgi:hypothetical protein
LESSDCELGGCAQTSDKIVDALVKAGVISVEENGEGPGVRMRKEKKR